MADIDTSALTAIIGALQPLTSEDRHRTVEAAMTFLGERPSAAAPQHKGHAGGAAAGGAEGGQPSGSVTERWMEQNGISAEELEQAFHFNEDGTFELHAVPGQSQKERTLNTYVLTGLGEYLAKGDRKFADADARELCVRMGCYSATNHSTYLKSKHPEFAGDKDKGYSLTPSGMKRGAVLVKELAKEG
jgi:hypothetical protein